MKHEEAIKILRETHDNALFSVRTALETICPQLAESEDERIMSRIIDGFKNFSRSASKWNNIPIEEVIAYLEKQKESENVSASTMAPSCWAEEPSLQKEQKPLKVGENAYFDPNTDMWFIKEEQKPAED